MDFVERGTNCGVFVHDSEENKAHCARVVQVVAVGAQERSWRLWCAALGLTAIVAGACRARGKISLSGSCT